MCQASETETAVAPPSSSCLFARTNCNPCWKHTHFTRRRRRRRIYLRLFLQWVGFKCCRPAFITRKTKWPSFASEQIASTSNYYYYRLVILIHYNSRASSIRLGRVHGRHQVHHVVTTLGPSASFSCVCVPFVAAQYRNLLKSHSAPGCDLLLPTLGSWRGC